MTTQGLGPLRMAGSASLKNVLKKAATNIPEVPTAIGRWSFSVSLGNSFCRREHRADIIRWEIPERTIPYRLS
jgi:hypothetical protein